MIKPTFVSEKPLAPEKHMNTLHIINYKFLNSLVIFGTFKSYLPAEVISNRNLNSTTKGGSIKHSISDDK